MTEADAHLVALSEQQHSLVADRQVRALGLTRGQWRHRVARGDWVRVSPNVVRRAGAEVTPPQRALAAVLDGGELAFLAFESGLGWWGFPGARVEPYQVVVVRGRARVVTLAEVHRPVHDLAGHHSVVNGVPVARPALLVLEAAAESHPDRLKRIVDWFWTRRLLSPRSIEAELEPLMHRGRAGVVAVRDLLASLPEGYTPPASGLEGRVHAIVTAAGLPAMRGQVDLGGDDDWCGRVDFLAHDLPFVLEVDSELHHSALSDVIADQEREARLVAAGFVVRRVTETQAWHHKEEVVAAVRSGRAEAASRTGPPTGRSGSHSVAGFATPAEPGHRLVVPAATW